MKSWGSHKTKILFVTKHICRSLIFWAPSAKGMPGCTILLWNGSGLTMIYWYNADGKTFEYQPDSNTFRLRPLFTVSPSRLSLLRVLLFFCINNYKSRKIVVDRIQQLNRNVFA
jgi:hypothetical protein